MFQDGRGLRTAGIGKDAGARGGRPAPHGPRTPRPRVTRKSAPPCAPRPAPPRAPGLTRPPGRVTWQDARVTPPHQPDALAAGGGRPVRGRLGPPGPARSSLRFEFEPQHPPSPTGSEPPPADQNCAPALFAPPRAPGSLRPAPRVRSAPRRPARGATLSAPRLRTCARANRTCARANRGDQRRLKLPAATTESSAR